MGFETTTDEVIQGIDLTGRAALVTGASSGLGAETARVLASAGAAVTMTARDIPKVEAVAEEIRAATGATVDVGELSLDRPDSVRAFAKQWLADHDVLHLLINNAGVMACPQARTAEGWEMQFATNHLGHFLLTSHLLPALRAGAPARVVNLSSAGHRFSPVNFDDVHFDSHPYDKWVSYGQSKTANVLFSIELDRRYQNDGIRAFAVHPGAIMTELGRHLDADDIQTLQSRAPKGGMKFKRVPAGAATQVWAATSPELEGKGGLYCEDTHVAGPRQSEDSAEGYLPWAMDAEAAAKLWALSEETLGETFGA
jgi:NAD(P)-dependent dehydrogenase (short-subunit alcohol dehydrogenase family)